MKPPGVEEKAKHGPEIRAELQDLGGQIAAVQAQHHPVKA